MTGKSSLFCGRLSFNHQIQSKKQSSFKSWGIVAVVAMMFVLLFSATLAVGQSVSSGTVVGTINDPSGAVVPGAEITMTDHTTNITIKATSNQDGHFAFANVAPSTYDIKITKSGFETALIREQQVLIGQTLTESVTLTVGSVTQEVTVQTTGTELQTLNATVGNTVTGVALESLPAIGGDVTTFMTLQPGVSPTGYVGGENSDQSTFQLDGGNNTSDMDGNMTVYTPSYGGDPTGNASNSGLRGGQTGGGVPTGVMPTPADSIEEFKVNTANQTADFNSSSGAQVQIVTKRGTNAIHGGLYEYYLDNNWNANSWQNNLSGTPLPDFHYSRFGAYAGGPLIPKNILGGKTYIFGMYQGFRWPNSQTDEVSVPSQNMRNGLISFDGGKTFTALAPNDPRAATDVGSGINPTIQAFWNKYLPLPNDPSCGSLSSSYCDLVNVQGYKGNIAIPQTDNFGVVRIDHDFGAKWHFNASYHYYHLLRATADQTDIGGFFTGDTIGTFSSLSNRPQVPWYYAAGLTTNISSNVTNDVHYSFLRNWWAWETHNAPPQLPGLQQAIEPLGEQQTNTLAPFNVNAQQIRTRFWDGMDHYVRDDLTMLHGNHLFSFGGAYQHDYDYHQRTDNGGGINFTPTDQLGDSSGAGNLSVSSALAGFYPGGAAAENQIVDRYIAAMLGMVTDSQVALTRTGANLTLNPPLTPAFDQSVIPYYNFYFSDSWHLKPTVTLTYGLGYTLEMPPHEINGKQVLLVNSADEQIGIQDYLDQRARSAEAGQIYNPELGFALVGNTANSPKYPYLPFYGEFSPRVAVAWNPHFSNGWLSKIFGADSSVVRAGYGRIYGRLNGVNQVLVPLLGPGLIQAVQCTQVLASGTCGPANPTASTVYRIGVDGLNAPIGAASTTLPQPDFPGFSVAGGIPLTAAAEGTVLDPHTKPSNVDSIDFTIQRQLNNKITMEVGYIGRFIHNEFAPIDINAVPYMMTDGGQAFENAYANLEVALGCATSVANCGAAVPASGTAAYAAYINALPQQAFLTSSLNSSYCTGTFKTSGVAYQSCTAAFVDKQLANLKNQAVWNIWTSLDNGGSKPGFNFGCTMLTCATFGPNSAQLVNDFQVNSSLGYGNYHAGFVTLRMNAFHGVTLQSNLTYSKALGLGDVAQSSSLYTLNDPFNFNEDYGLQSWDRKFIYNMFMVYQDPFYKNQQGFLGHLLGGWNWSPIFTAGSGAPLFCTTQSTSQSFGSNSHQGQYGDFETCGFTGSLGSDGTANYGVAGGTDTVNPKISVGTSVAQCVNAACGKGGVAVPINYFANPVASFNQIVDPILGLTQTDGGEGPIHGLPYWNVDMSLRKDIKLTERFSAQFQFLALNAFNHMYFANPSFSAQSPTTFGVLKTQANTPRQMEFGLRVTF